VSAEIDVGSRVRVHLAEHCDEPDAWEWGVVDHVYPGARAFTVKFDELRTEVVARYEIKEVQMRAKVDTDWLQQQMSRYRAMRLPCETYDAILACLDELDGWRKATS